MFRLPRHCWLYFRRHRWITDTARHHGWRCAACGTECGGHDAAG